MRLDHLNVLKPLCWVRIQELHDQVVGLGGNLVFFVPDLGEDYLKVSYVLKDLVHTRPPERGHPDQELVDQTAHPPPIYRPRVPLPV